MQDIVDTSDARSVEICGESWNRPVVKPTSFDLDQNNISRRSQRTTYFVKIVSNLILIKRTHFQDARKEQHILRKATYTI